MHLPRFASICLASALACGALLTGRASGSTSQLATLDTTTTSGYLDVRVSIYEKSTKTQRYTLTQQYPAQLLFQRPGNIRLTLRPGAKDEFRMAVTGGWAQWLDLSTGNASKLPADQAIDPLALAVLAKTGALLRLSGAKNLPLPVDSKLDGVRLRPNVWGTTVAGGNIWLNSDSRLVGFDFLMTDGDRVQISVQRFVQNPKIKPGDFVL